MSENQKPNKSQNENQSSQPSVRRGGGGGPMRMMPGEKPLDFKGTMKQLIGYLGKYNWIIVIVLLLAAASTVFQIFGPKILGQATTLIFEGVMDQISGSGGGINFSAVADILIRVLILYVISAFLNFLQGYVMSGVSMDITYRFRQDIAKKINRLPLQYFDRVSQGEVLSRVTNDVDTVSQTLNQSMSQIIRSTSMVVGILIMMLSISWTMTIIAILTVPLSFVAIRIIVRHYAKILTNSSKNISDLSTDILKKCLVGIWLSKPSMQKPIPSRPFRGSMTRSSVQHCYPNFYPI